MVSPLDGTPLLDAEEDLVELVEKSPTNVHYFFLKEDDGGVSSWVDEMSDRIDQALEEVDDEDFWAARLHVVTEPVPELGQWVDEAMDSGAPGFGIDRFQQIREIGSLADVTRYSTALNNAGAWPWEANVAYVAHEALYYNYRSDLQDRLDAVDWTSRYLFYDEPIQATGRSRAWVDMPDAATMAGFDTLLIDLRHICDPSQQEWGNCDAWDANNRLSLCSADDPDVCDDPVLRRRPPGDRGHPRLPRPDRGRQSAQPARHLVVRAHVVVPRQAGGPVGLRHHRPGHAGPAGGDHLHHQLGRSGLRRVDQPADVGHLLALTRWAWGGTCDPART